MDDFSHSEPPHELSAKQFELLTARYLDGLTTAEEVQTLSEHLAANPELRSQFAAFCIQIGVLGEMLANSHSVALNDPLFIGEQRSPEVSTGEFSKLDAATGDYRTLRGMPYLTPFVRDALGNAGRRLVSPRGIAVIGLAIVIAAATVLWLSHRASSQLNAQREPQLIASLKNSAHATWKNGRTLADGAQFSEGEALELVEGEAQVSMSCGAELVLRSPCSLELSSSNQVLLRQGLVCIQLAEWTSGFTVATDSVQILDLGKQFVVSADAKSGEVEAHAIDGKLRVQTKDALVEKQYGMLVTEGEAIRIQPANNTSTRLKADGQLFDIKPDDVRPYKPIAIFNTGRGLTPGEEDSHWRIVSSSADDFGGPQYAIACRQITDNYLPNEPDSSQWVTIGKPIDGKCPPNTMYTFETEFDLSDYDLSTVKVVAHVLADNGVMGVRINGQPVQFKPWMSVYGLFDSYRKVEVINGFVAGTNRIQFDVWNSIVMSYPEDANPTGLRVEWQAFGRLKQQAAAGHTPQAESEFPRIPLSTISSRHWFERRL